MEIVDKRDNGYILLEDLEFGATFIYKDLLYSKRDSCLPGSVYCFQTAKMGYISPNTNVTPVKCLVTIVE